MIFDNIRPAKSHGDGDFSLDKFLKIGENVIFEDGVRVFHPETIEIGDNVYIGHDSFLKGYFRGKMIIGEHTWIGQSCFLHSAGNITIGKAVGMGPYVKILTSVHREVERSKPIIANDLDFGEVVIHDGCDIGIGAIILPGITVGEGAIVGAGAVVTKDVPDYSVVAGNPAHILRTRK